MNALLLAIAAGVLSGVGGTVVAGLFIRKKTRAETASAFATAANTLAQGAGDLVASNATRIADLERRLAIAEQAATLAHSSALQARESEMRCLVRLDAMEKQIADMRHQMATPLTTTTVTTAVTKQGE